MLFLYCALPLADNLTRMTVTPPAMSRLTFTHPLVFTHSCSHPRSHCDSPALSLKDEADNIRTNLAGQSRATHNRSQRTLETGNSRKVEQNSAQGIVTFGRNVLICPNLSYCNCFEKNRSFITKVDLPRSSIQFGHGAGRFATNQSGNFSCLMAPAGPWEFNSFFGVGNSFSRFSAKNIFLTFF